MIATLYANLYDSDDPDGEYEVGFYVELELAEWAGSVIVAKVHGAMVDGEWYNVGDFGRFGPAMVAASLDSFDDYYHDLRRKFYTH